MTCMLYLGYLVLWHTLQSPFRKEGLPPNVFDRCMYGPHALLGTLSGCLALLCTRCHLGAGLPTQQSWVSSWFFFSIGRRGPLFSWLFLGHSFGMSLASEDGVPSPRGLSGSFAYGPHVLLSCARTPAASRAS